ncbi:MAG: bacillithiol biosynthesis BshC [Promethearchaeota archaeon]
MTTLAPPNELYSEYVFNGNKKALKFWGPIPHNMKEAVTLSKSIIKAYREKHQPLFTPERFNDLLKAIQAFHQKHKALTPNVKQNIALLEEQYGVVEAGHQPALLGGPGFVINKLAAIARLAAFQNTAPIMFVGDHDHEQKELTVIHLPSPGPRGLIFTYRVPHEYQLSPLHVLPLPRLTWLKQVVEKITSTYHEMVAGSGKEKKGNYETRIERLRQLLVKTYNQANTFSEWTVLIWIQIINMSQDVGILFQIFSDQRIRDLMLPAFEYLLASSNRTHLIQALNQSATQLENLGYQPGIGIRTDNYVPFHLECPTQGCHRTRLDPHLTNNTTNSTIEVSADCPKCNTTHSLELKASSPDLSAWRDYLSPRVDTRAFLVQSYTPVILHCGGAGETDYHAQVSPALNAIKSVVPIFFRYTRLYYGNPWTHRQSQKLSLENLNPLDISELQCYSSAILTGYKEENMGVIQSLFAASNEHITKTAAHLIQVESQIEKKRMDTIILQRDASEPTIKKELQAEIGVLTRRRQLIQTYLSQMFGRYSPERFGQEVSFAWIDFALSLSPEHLFSRLSSHYQPLTPSAATFYLSEKTN